MMDEYARLREENIDLRADNVDLRDKLSLARQGLLTHEATIGRIYDQLATLQRERDELRAEVERLRWENAALSGENVHVPPDSATVRIEDLAKGPNCRFRSTAAKEGK